MIAVAYSVRSAATAISDADPEYRRDHDVDLICLIRNMAVRPDLMVSESAGRKLSLATPQFPDSRRPTNLGSSLLRMLTAYAM